jgi:hypothetical protein
MTVTGESDWEGSSTVALNLTFQNITFTGSIVITGISNGNVLINHDSFNNFQASSSCSGQPARIHLAYNNGSTLSGITVANSSFIDPTGGGPNAEDGIQTATGMTILNSVFENLLDNGGCNHVDSIQGVNATGIIASGNLFLNDYDGFVDYDGASHDTATDNACYNIQRGGNPCITLYGDQGSTVNHNTAGNGTVLELNTKSGQSAPSGTIFENNAGGVCGCSSYQPTTSTHNLYVGASAPNINGTATFTGPLTTWAGFMLAPTSAGHGAATDGTDVGI